MTDDGRPPSGTMRHIRETRGFDARPQPPRSRDPDAGGIMTKHGWFSDADIGAAEGRIITDAHGHRVLHFPTWSNERGKHDRVIPEHKLVEGDLHAGNDERRTP